MKETTHKNLSKRLAKYGAFSMAIAGITDASGQIIYTDVNPDEGGAGVSYLLDLNNDSTDDFAVFHINSLTSSGYYFYNVLAAAAANTNNAILGIDAGAYEYPYALNSGAVISGGLTTWVNTNFQTLNYSSCNFTNSNWCANTIDKYLGLRFTVGGNLHYGWARLEVGATSSDWLIKDYAYNSTPGAAINAGQGTLNTVEQSLTNIRIVALNKSIALYNLPENSNYQLFSVSGQMVLKGSINSDSYVIEANVIETGVYILELKDVATNSIIRKKIIL